MFSMGGSGTKKVRSKKLTHAFIDASNLFYGGVKSLGWKIDYHKLIKYIKRQYGVSKIFYYGGIELEGFKKGRQLRYWLEERGRQGK